MKYHETYAHLPSIRTFMRSRRFIPYRIVRLFKAITIWATIVFLPLSFVLLPPWLITRKPIYWEGIKLSLGAIGVVATIWAVAMFLHSIVGFPPLPAPQRIAEEILKSKPKPNSWITHKDLAQIPYGPKRWPYLPKTVKRKAIQWAMEVIHLIETEASVKTEENPITSEIQITFLTE